MTNPARTTAQLPAHRKLMELDVTIHSGGCRRLVPDPVPRMYDPLDQDLLERVSCCLERLAK